MAKGKPSKAFLEALKQDKKRRGTTSGGPGDEKPGAFSTPDWFFQGAAKPNPNVPKGLAPMSVNSGGGGRQSFRPSPIHLKLAGGLLGLFILAFFLANGSNKPPVDSRPTSDVKKDDAQSDVMDIQADRAAGPVIQPPAPVPVVTPGVPAGTPGVAAADEPAPVEVGRVIGMNYVIMQSFETEAGANEAADALRKAGIGCTVEKNHPFTRANWFLVVGTTAFPTGYSTSPKYQQYIKKVMQVSDQYAGKSKWKRLAPTPYRWR